MSVILSIPLNVLVSFNAQGASLTPMLKLNVNLTIVLTTSNKITGMHIFP